MGLISLSLLGLIKCWGGGGVVVQKYFSAFEKMKGGGHAKCFMDEKKCWGGEGGWAHIF